MYIKLLPYMSGKENNQNMARKNKDRPEYLKKNEEKQPNFEVLLELERLL